MIFDGKTFAEEKVEQLLALPDQKRKKTLAVLVDPENSSGMKYVQMKKKLGERLGVRVLVFHEIDQFFAQEADGQMIQLPYKDSAELIKKIDMEKDVDGLKEDSIFLPATVRAVREILKSAHIKKDATIVVVGVWGVVGSAVANELGKTYTVTGMDKEDFNENQIREADVVISATGRPGLIGPNMVKQDAVVIDVGFPKGDFDLEVEKKASFFTPVPGGVGPVTVVSLFENLLGA